MNFETLLRLYYLRHGFESYDFALTQYLPLLAFSPFLDAGLSLSRLDQESLRSTILLAAKGLWDQGRNILICKAIYYVLRDSLKDSELRRELAYFGDDALEEMSILREVRSTWPVGVFNVARGDRDFSLFKYIQAKRTPQKSVLDSTI